MDAASLMTELESVDQMTDYEMEVEESKSFIPHIQGEGSDIYGVIRKTVNVVFETYSYQGQELLSKSEVRGFLKDFLVSYDEDADCVDIVLHNMNTDSTGKIDKYNLAVFFLKLAAYEFLVN